MRKFVIKVSCDREKITGALLAICLTLLSANQGCAIAIPRTPTTWTTPALPILQPTQTFTKEFLGTDAYLETASVKDIKVTDEPTATRTPTQVPIGTFVLMFYSPLIMSYDSQLWVDKSKYREREFMTNHLLFKELPKCSIGVQGPTDFNGPHTNETVQLGDLSYEVLTFPDLAQDTVSKAYLADLSLVTEVGRPVFWVSAKPDKWEICKGQAEIVLSTLRFP